MKRVLLAALALLLPSASLAEDLTGGRVAKFIDKDGTSRDRAVVRFVRDPGIVAPLPDPTVDPSWIRLMSDTTDTCTVSLDAARWQRAGDGFVYKFPPKESPPGGIFKIVFKPGRSGGKLVIEAKGDGYGANPLSGPVEYAQASFAVGETAYTGRFEATPETERSNTSEKILLKGKGASVAVNPGHEVFDTSGFPGLLIGWGTTELTPDEYDALPLDSGWMRNQSRGGGGAGQFGRFLRSPGAAADGEFTQQEMWGVSWLHQVNVFPLTNDTLDPQGLLRAVTVEKYHELGWCAGSSVAILTSPEGDRYIRVSRDAERTSDTPTIPDDWTLESFFLEDTLAVRLLEQTTVIRTDNEDSFQGPLPSDLDL
jgi:hypothetical protein